MGAGTHGVYCSVGGVQSSDATPLKLALISLDKSNIDVVDAPAY